MDSAGLLLQLEILIHLSRKPSDRRQVVMYGRNYASRRHLKFLFFESGTIDPVSAENEKGLTHVPQTAVQVNTGRERSQLE